MSDEEDLTATVLLLLLEEVRAIRAQLESDTDLPIPLCSPAGLSSADAALEQMEQCYPLRVQ